VIGIALLLPEIDVPTLIIAGEQDPITPRPNEKSTEVNRAITAFVTGRNSGVFEVPVR